MRLLWCKRVRCPLLFLSRDGGELGECHGGGIGLGVDACVDAGCEIEAIVRWVCRFELVEGAEPCRQKINKGMVNDELNTSEPMVRACETTVYKYFLY